MLTTDGSYMLTQATTGLEDGNVSISQICKLCQGQEISTTGHTAISIFPKARLYTLGFPLMLLHKKL